jgi:outer membrane protein TolC
VKAKPLLALCAAAALSACTPSYFQQDADRQAQKIVAERQREALGYQPQVEVLTPKDAEPAKPAFQKVPVTRMPPPITSPVEYARVQVDLGPLGPDASLKDSPVAPWDAGSSDVARPNDLPTRVFGPPDPADRAIYLDLFACLEYGVRNSRTYRAQMEELYIAALGVTTQRHVFDLTPFARTRLQYDGAKGDNPDFQSALRVTSAAGVRQRLPLGGELTASAVHSFVEAINSNLNEGESAQAVFAGSMPLLRGFGMVNLEPLIQSERNVVYQVRAFEAFRRDFVVTIAARYFQLLAQQQGIANRRLNLRSLAALTERTNALYGAQKLIFLEVQRSLQSQLQAETLLVNATEAYIAALDDFKITLGMPVSQQMDVVPVVLDVNTPRMEPEDAIETAMRYRLDLQTAEDQIDDARRGIAIARNDLLPDLNLDGQIGVGGDTPGTIDFNNRHTTYQAGLTFELPLDRVAERNSLRVALISVEQAQRNVVGLRDTIAADVRQSLRAISAAEANVEIQRRGIDLARRRLEYSNELLKSSKGSSRDVIEAQTSLLDAQDRYEQARATLQTRVLEFMRDTGTLRVDPTAGAIGRAMDRTAEPRLKP